MTWNKDQIRAARKTPLVPLLQFLGFELLPLPHGNFLVTTFEDLTVKDCFWHWPSMRLQGNSIDFFVHVTEHSFHQAMQIITECH